MKTDEYLISAEDFPSKIRFPLADHGLMSGSAMMHSFTTRANSQAQSPSLTSDSEFSCANQAGTLLGCNLDFPLYEDDFGEGHGRFKHLGVRQPDLLRHTRLPEYAYSDVRWHW